MVQKGRVSSGCNINPWKPIHQCIYIWKRKINKVRRKSIIIFSPYISHREDFRLDQKRKSSHQTLTSPPWHEFQCKEWKKQTPIFNKKTLHFFHKPQRVIQQWILTKSKQCSNLATRNIFVIISVGLSWVLTLATTIAKVLYQDFPCIYWLHWLHMINLDVNKP